MLLSSSLIYFLSLFEVLSIRSTVYATIAKSKQVRRTGYCRFVHRFLPDIFFNPLLGKNQGKKRKKEK
jgi:hypothetical protein